jgi:hypothetical protein
VVLLGGHESAPAEPLNSLPTEMRKIKFKREDEDRWIVWSDDGYGDTDGDGIPEIPVSRLPDGADPALIAGALSLPPFTTSGEGSGIRNEARPFAATIFDRFPKPKFLASCAPAYPAVQYSPELLYLMLHGHWETPGLFRGEEPNTRSFPVAIDLGTLPEFTPSVVFAGCCYGALTVRQRAADSFASRIADSIPRTESIALTCLGRGTHAFVGCTAVHYSPIRGFFNLGAPMHQHFFQELFAGHPPAAALLLAKQKYAQSLPSRGPSATPFEIAAEHKILRQFTCLGVGW